MHNDLSENLNKDIRSIKIKMEIDNRNRLIGTGNILIVARWEGGWRIGEKGEEIKKYKLVVTE